MSSPFQRTCHEEDLRADGDIVEVSATPTNHYSGGDPHVPKKRQRSSIPLERFTPSSSISCFPSTRAAHNLGPPQRKTAVSPPKAPFRGGKRSGQQRHALVSAKEIVVDRDTNSFVPTNMDIDAVHRSSHARHIPRPHPYTQGRNLHHAPARRHESARHHHNAHPSDHRPEPQRGLRKNFSCAIAHPYERTGPEPLAYVAGPSSASAARLSNGHTDGTVHNSLLDQRRASMPYRRDGCPSTARDKRVRRRESHELVGSYTGKRRIPKVPSEDADFPVTTSNTHGASKTHSEKRESTRDAAKSSDSVPLPKGKKRGKPSTHAVVKPHLRSAPAPLRSYGQTETIIVDDGLQPEKKKIIVPILKKTKQHANIRLVQVQTRETEQREEQSEGRSHVTVDGDVKEEPIKERNPRNSSWQESEPIQADHHDSIVDVDVDNDVGSGVAALSDAASQTLANVFSRDSEVSGGRKVRNRHDLQKQGVSRPDSFRPKSLDENAGSHLATPLLCSQREKEKRQPSASCDEDATLQMDGVESGQEAPSSSIVMVDEKHQSCDREAVIIVLTEQFNSGSSVLLLASYGLDTDDFCAIVQSRIPEPTSLRKKLVLSNNMLSVWKDDFCKKLVEWTVFDLNLSKNRLHTLESGISQCKNLRILDLSRNDLASVPRGVCDLVNLELLDLACNNLHKLPLGFHKLAKLEILDLSKNKLDCLPADWVAEGSVLSTLNVSENPSLTVFPFCSKHLKKLVDFEFCGTAFYQSLRRADFKLAPPRIMAEMAWMNAAQLAERRLLARSKGTNKDIPIVHDIE